MDIHIKLDDLLRSDDLSFIKKELNTMKDYLQSQIIEEEDSFIIINNNGHSIKIKPSYLISELEQSSKAYTLERTKYYIQRLLKSMQEAKTNRINDINLNRWKEYDDIITDSLWIMDKRDTSGAHTAGYWGNFIPQIPNQLLRRYTKKGEWILDPFLGSGTTLMECRRLGRNGIGVELQKNIIKLAKENLDKDYNLFKSESHIHIICDDSTNMDFKKELQKIGINSVQFILLHPPYWDIIPFSNDKEDLSNAKSLDLFLDLFEKVVDQTYPVLDKNRFLAVVIGDKYTKGELIPLGFYLMQEVLKKGYKLKSTIVKNFETTKAKMNQKELWRYRAMVGNFYVFKHEYIFIFEKVKG